MNVAYHDRELWAKSYYTVDTKAQLWLLEHTPDERLCLYVSKDKITSGPNGNEDMLGRNPVYHVWNGNEWLYCGQSQRAAYDIYEKAKGQTEWANT